MKWLLGRLGLPKAIGLYLDEETITVSRIVSTPVGPVEITRHTEAIGDEALGDAIARLVRPLVGKGRFRRTPVCVGVPSRKVYFSTRPVHAAMGDLAPHVLLREALRSPSVPVHEMVVDVVKSSLDSRDVASIAACDRTYLNEILDALARMDIRPWLTEPAPCALLRLASKRHRARRGDKVVLRLFLSQEQVLAVLTVGKVPILWRLAQVMQGKEAASLVTAARSLSATSKDCGVESSLDAVMIHGRMELKRLLDVDWMESQLDATINWFNEPMLDPSQIALGLAQGGLDKDTSGFDLGRSLKPRPTLWETFPWREAVLQLALVACMGLFLGYKYSTLQQTRQSLEVIAAASSTETSANKRQLQKEKKDMETQVQAVREFLDSRVLWTTCLRDLADCVPRDMRLTSVQGVCELRNMRDKRARSKSKKFFLLRGTVTVPPNGTTPREIDRLLVALRSDPTLDEDFPLVTLDELKQIQPRPGEDPAAIFAVICMPLDKKSAGKKGPKAAAGAKKGKKPQ
ncbi:MAG TPA: hypothetical protein VJL29_04240 [Thermoguttaceae bacterium]|nr:hypothetical protein [Thermoguttaceae bacterium]